MKLFLRFAAIAALLLPFSPAARADHGQNFLMLQDADISAPGDGHLLGTFSWERYGGEDSFGLSPGFNVGLLPRVALSVHAAFGDEGDGWTFRSVLPELHIDLTPRDSGLPFRVALSAGYQFADDSNKPETRRAYYVEEQRPRSGKSARRAAAPRTAPADTATTPPPPSNSGPDAPGNQQGPDAPGSYTPKRAPKHSGHGAEPAPKPAKTQPASAGRRGRETEMETVRVKRYQTLSLDHYHSAVHNHDDDLFTARLILEADLTPSTLFVFNVISVVPDHGDAGWGYAAGIRQTVSDHLALGIEALGDFDSRGQQNLLGAAYWTPIHHFTLKLGAGAGLTKESPDFSLRAGLVWEWH